ncbi:FtsX-like permease family protein [Nigerium massiliense]|uniref:FtsX-like permease family protein n=1 Tax=Nigerium massiliense TaxID=1522317 RepID=UPI00058FF5E5|nr:FtsX-like permease family protein [Nigerium massiliense]
MSTLTLAPMLTRGRLKSRAGDGWLDVLAVVSNALSAAVALTVAGGVWMFYSWWQNPTPRVLERLTALWGPTADDRMIYFVLALVALGLLVVPVFSLGASAAKLGAQGRSERLASLRLVGLTSSQTVGLATLETLVQWALGAVVGLVAYFATLPLWAGVTFAALTIDPAEMLLPAWLLAAVLAALLAITLASSVLGLQRVRISPLGVTRRQTPRALKAWRVLLLAAVVVAFFGYAAIGGSRNINGVAAVAGFLAITIGSISLAVPFLIQLLALPLTRTRRASLLLAARRILDDPRATWRSISAITLLCFVAGFTSVMSISGEDPQLIIMQDLRTGVLITVAIGFGVAAMATLMNQASLVFDNAAQTLALSQMGFPKPVFTRVRVLQSFVPLLLASVIFAALGRALGVVTSSSQFAQYHSSDQLLQLVAILAAGLALCLLALAVCSPLERHVLAAQGRAND